MPKFSAINILFCLTTCICCVSSFAVAEEKGARLFEKPVLIRAGGEIYNREGIMRYPSPAIVDIQNDGIDELIVGSLFGRLQVCSDQNEGKGTPKWSAPEFMKDVDGETIKLNNW